MNVSNRQRHILEMLLNRNGEITASEIAGEIKVSVRTIHRELPELEKALETYGVSLRKKSGFGIQLLAEPQQLDELKRSLSLTGHADYSTDERKILIACSLLESDEPTKLFALAHDLRVAVPTISSDLDQLEDWIAKYGLTLVRRRGFGVQLEGPESTKRKVIYMLAKDRLDDSAIFGQAADLPPPSPVTAKLLSMVGKANLMKVEQALWGLEEDGLNELSESAYTDLLLRLSVAVTRIRQGFEIKPPEGTHVNDSPIPDLVDANSTAESIVDRAMLLQLSEALDLTLSTGEAIYLSELLRGEADSSDSRLLPRDDLSLMETVGKLIRAMEELSGAPLSEDRSLRDGLLNHIEPVLQRIGEGVHIRNPLLSQIKKNYELLFRWVRQAVDQTFRQTVIPDEEVGFLVMHFGASIERLKQLSRNVKAIVVCTSGIGSSKLLAVRLGKEMPQIEIIDHVSWYEASRIPKGAYDLIISTVDLPLEAGQYIKLSPLLTKDEIEKLRLYVQDITLKRPDESYSTASLEVQAWDRLRQWKVYMDEIVSLIEQFEVFHLDPAPAPEGGKFPDLRGTLRKVCLAVNKDGSLSEVEPVVELLLEREKHGTQVIPDTRLALFHTRSEFIRRPMLSTIRLSAPLTLDPEHPVEVSQIVLMLGPLELSRESLEVLSEISALLLLPQLITLLETGSDLEIKQFLSKELLHFYINKTEMGRGN